MSSTAAILPVKRFAAAKQRLSPAVASERRRDLAAAMVADVLEALGRVSGLRSVIVVSGEPQVRELTRRAGAEWVADERDAGQSAAAGLGIERALREGSDRVLLVPGDCPALDAGEVAGLLEPAGPGSAVTVVPDRHGTGTNALLLSPPTVIRPAFGPGSCQRHLGLARAAGAQVAIEALNSLALDVDTAGDLAALERVLARSPDRAPRTREALARLLSDAA